MTTEHEANQEVVEREHAAAEAKYSKAELEQLVEERMAEHAERESVPSEAERVEALVGLEGCYAFNSLVPRC